MANDNSKQNLLVGRKAIMEYIGLSEKLYNEFYTATIPMPILKFHRRHYATKVNLDKYFNEITGVDSSKIKDADNEGD